MARTIRALLQTTIPFREDDWHVGRFSLLRKHLASLPGVEVTARDRMPSRDGDDPVLSRLDESAFDEAWLLAVDVDDGLSAADASGISRFHRRGGGLLVTRDQQDVGSCLCALERVGAAHHFHTRNPEPDPARCSDDDRETPSIAWPNYRSGSNGDFQSIDAVEPVHPLLVAPALPGGRIRRLPAHPHEGAVGVPTQETAARVIARGRSQATGRAFELAVAFEARDGFGRAVAESSFHHFADYNWSIAAGCPRFVSERAGDGYLREPEALADARAYVENITYWLAQPHGGNAATADGG
jgi:hypothetical protein